MHKRGFTVLELLIVIVVFAILASIALPSYIRYQLKTKVSSYAEPAARSCLLDLVDYCFGNPGANATVLETAVTKLSNCKKLVGTYSPTPDETNFVVVSDNPNISNLYRNGTTLKVKNLVCSTKGQLTDTNGITADVVTLLVDDNGNPIAGYYAECSYSYQNGVKCRITTQPMDY